MYNNMEKIPNTHKVTIISTFSYNYPMEDYFEDFKNYCKDNGYEVQGEEENMIGVYMGGCISFYDYFQESIQTDIENFWDGLKHTKNKIKCVVTGTIGLWDGTRTIQPKCFENLYKAINTCATNAYDIVVSVENNVISVNAYHHDGTNRFEIYLLNDDDFDCVFNWEEETDGDIMDYIINNKMEVYYDYFETC